MRLKRRFKGRHQDLEFLHRQAGKIQELHRADLTLALEPRPVPAVQLQEVHHDPLRRLEGGRLEHRVPADHFLGLREGTVGDGHLAAGEPRPGPLGARRQAAGLHQRAVLERLLDEAAHRLFQPLRKSEKAHSCALPEGLLARRLWRRDLARRRQEPVHGLP